MSILETVIFFIFAFIVVLLLHILIINRGRKTYKEGKKITEINYLVYKYKLDMRKIKYNDLKWATTIANSLIVAFSTTVISVIHGVVWQILIGFALLVILILPTYEIIGRHYQKIGGKENGNEKNRK